MPTLREQNQRHVVVAGPRLADALHEGFVSFGAEVARHEADGVLWLPFDEAVAADPVGCAVAYQRRSYGLGHRFDTDLPARGCHLPVYFQAPAVLLEWAALVRYEDGAGGQLALAPGVVSPIGLERGEARFVSSPLADPGRALLRGAALAHGGQAGGWATVCLSGACTGLRVLWLAMTVSLP